MLAHPMSVTYIAAGVRWFRPWTVGFLFVVVTNRGVTVSARASTREFPQPSRFRRAASRLPAASFIQTPATRL